MNSIKGTENNSRIKLMRFAYSQKFYFISTRFQFLFLLYFEEYILTNNIHDYIIMAINTNKIQTCKKRVNKGTGTRLDFSLSFSNHNFAWAKNGPGSLKKSQDASPFPYSSFSIFSYMSDKIGIEISSFYRNYSCSFYCPQA